jgi:acyl-CoA synthetase (AMP-forming)/AMP-acid ligase II/acyl carrier protein
MHASSGSSHQNILTLLKNQSVQFGDAVAIQAPDGLTVSYAELYRRVAAMVSDLHAVGVTPDSRVAIVLPNGLDMAMALLGTSCAAIAVPFNPAYREPEYDAYFSETRVSHLLARKGIPSPARSVAERLGMQVLELADDCRLEGTSSAGGKTETSLPNPPAPAPDRVAMILLTSGSTGRPKRVPLTHRNLCASARDVRDSLSLGPQDCCLSMWEQHHIGGLVDLLLAPLASGGSVICAGSFDARRFYEILAVRSPTWFQGVPTTLRELIVYGKSRFNPLQPHSLRFLRSVAAALPPSLMEEVEHYFGVPVIQTFGMTEASPLITTNLLPPNLRKPGSAGKSCGPEVAIMDEHGTPLAPGKYGEVAVRGENIFSGYEDNPEANAVAFRNGWFYTGDTGYLDEDGYLFLRGRVKEMINRGGEKISPYELEDILSRHPAVAQLAAFAVPHPTLGEEVGVAVVAREGSQLTEASVRDFAGANLSAFKVPRTIIFLDALPRCPVGKVRRQDLADLALKSRSGAGFTAPRSELEAFLAKLWATELDLPQVGIDDDFSALGGDSLSSVRLLAAVKVLLGLDFSDDALAQFTTVRKMAQHMEKIGYAKPQNGNLLELELKSALATAASQDEFKHDDLAMFRSRLEHSTSMHEFKVLRESGLNKMTPAELAALMDEVSSVTWADLLARIPKGFSAWRVPFEFSSWRKQVRHEIAAFPDSRRWRRHGINENIQHYSASQSINKDKALIVGFCSSSMRLMMPISRFLMHLDADRFDVLLLRDPGRNHYVHGIPGVCGDIDSLCDWLRTRVADMGYSEVISIGTSAGGVASLCAGVANHWKRSISVGADAPSSHPALEKFLTRAAQHADTPPATEVMLFFGSGNQRDNTGAREISGILPFARQFGDPSLGKHNILEVAFKEGSLRNMFNKFFD